MNFLPRDSVTLTTPDTSEAFYIKAINNYGDVDLHPDSVEFLEKVFLGYTYVKECPFSLEGRLVLHMYPSQDTLNRDTGEADGFADSLFFRLDIYDLFRKLKYTVFRKDQIYLTNIGSNMGICVRLFKDGSTAIFSNYTDMKVDLLGSSVEVGVVV